MVARADSRRIRHAWRMARDLVIRKRRVARSSRASGVQLGEAEARARILGGAARLFSQGGVRDVSVENILEAAGVARRTFYRLYDGKEDVAVALYTLGTERLLDACRLGMSEESDPIRQIHRCVDAHLRSAHDVGRLVFVLGGEAQRHESALHPRRMEDARGARQAAYKVECDGFEENIDPLPRPSVGAARAGRRHEDRPRRGRRGAKRQRCEHRPSAARDDASRDVRSFR